ncbi:MAG TPA: hypothetical protein EYP14_01965 [Planctomycetaceae bacterium]|nr:hypothetical protein [Planctomycetaceae bacterium]
MMERLERRGAVNINLVGGEPTPNIPVILRALRQTGARLPIIWNSNLYCSAESMKLLMDVVDLWLPDFKYGNDACAQRLSGVKKYFSVVTRNLSMIRGREIGGKAECLCFEVARQSFVLHPYGVAHPPSRQRGPPLRRTESRAPRTVRPPKLDVGSGECTELPFAFAHCCPRLQPVAFGRSRRGLGQSPIARWADNRGLTIHVSVGALAT